MSFFDALTLLHHYLSSLGAMRFQTRAALESWQMRQFKRFSRNLLIRSPYYRGFAEHGVALDGYPVIDKKVMVEEFDRINTRGLRRSQVFELATKAEKSRDFRPMLDDVSVGLSSGTSGRRGLFVASKKERLQYAGIVLSKCLPDTIFTPNRVALLLRANNQLYESIGGGKIVFRYFDLFSAWSQILADLNAFEPTILVGPPQMLALLARAQAQGEIRLTPKKIIAGAEVLDNIEVSAISSVFGQPVHQVYQATEGFLGATCKFGTIHLNEDYLIFERHWIDRASGRFMPVITDFTRSTQPVIRYRLDDVLIERPTSSPCPCGSLYTAVERIEGRCDDILFLPCADRSQLVPIMPDFIRDALSALHPVIGDYSIAQLSPDEIEFSTAGSDSSAARSCLCEAFAHLCKGMRVCLPKLTERRALRVDPREKLRRVKRLFPMPEGVIWNEC